MTTDFSDFTDEKSLMNAFRRAYCGICQATTFRQFPASAGQALPAP
jgi:hypothetical protein